MAEAHWYYSHGDEQLGPVTGSQLKKLAAEGKLAPTDLVWKEGMDDWVAASTIDGLVPIVAPPTAESPVVSTTSTGSNPPPTSAPAISTQPRDALNVPRRSAARSDGGGGLTDMLGYTRYIAYPALVFGLLLAMMSRGCDQLSSRGIQAAQAKVALADQKFKSEWTRKRQDLEDDRDAAREDESTERVKEIGTKLSELDGDRAEERNKLQRGKWRDLQEDADSAQFDHAIGGWWRELFFRFGTIMLAFGLLGVGLTGKGADRWVCLVILVIIIMNLYGTQIGIGLRGG
ncbi:MAG: DUF4339 domain-containing protein [Planctomycetes bacterium]|nr:DUF4339 domain-containing protein [Planctomycetota bacterium]